MRPVGSLIERPAPLRHAVFDALVEMIITRELQPGQHLVEKDLAASLGVSRQPLREALQRMHAEGWVDLRPALGAFVHIPTESEADELLAARSILEAESAKLGAERATPEQVEHLWELQRIGEEALAVDDQQVLLSANASLHTYIVAMSGTKTTKSSVATRFRADRKSWAVLRRRVFRDPPTERNRVWQTDFSEFETAHGGIWRISAVIDYVTKYCLAITVTPTSRARARCTASNWPSQNNYAHEAL